MKKYHVVVFFSHCSLAFFVMLLTQDWGYQHILYVSCIWRGHDPWMLLTFG